VVQTRGHGSADHRVSGLSGLKAALNFSPVLAVMAATVGWANPTPQAQGIPVTMGFVDSHASDD